MIELKRKAFCKFKKSKTNESKNYYLQIKNIVNITVKAEKKAYYSMDINNLDRENNAGSLWNKIASWKLVNKKSKVVPAHLRNADSINNAFLDSIPQSNVDHKVVDDFLSMPYG
jgi:argininosuccinate synthase